MRTLLSRLAIHSCHLCRGVEASGAGHPEEAEEEVVSSYNFEKTSQLCRVAQLWYMLMDDWIGFGSPGGGRYGAPHGANKP